MIQAEASQTLISLNDVEFSWRENAPTCIQHCHLNIEQHEHVFIQGSSGSGKSTLLNIVGGIVVPQKGQVNVLGKNLCALSPVQRDDLRADHIGFIFQQFNLIPYLSIIENVSLPCRFSELRLQNAIDRSGSVLNEAKYLLNRLQLHTNVESKHATNELSVGQQQRVAAARALIGQPKIIIADEPTSSLDHEARQAFMELMFDEVNASGSTLVYVSHDPSHKHLFDRILNMSALSTGGETQQ